MINKRILTGGISIVAALALMGGTAFALFSDTATSQNNTFSTGNADLLIAPDVDNLPGGSPGTYADDIVSPINQLDVIPGFNKTYYFWLKNVSTSSIDFNLAATFDDVVTTGNSDVANQLAVTINCGTAGGPFSVNVWDGGSAPIGTLLAGAQTECSMVVSLPDVDNTYEDSSVRFDGVFTGTQVPTP